MGNCVISGVFRMAVKDQDFHDETEVCFCKRKGILGETLVSPIVIGGIRPVDYNW